MTNPSSRFAVWPCHADGKPFGQPQLLRSELTPEQIQAGTSFKLHIEAIDSDAWEVLADRQHSLHESYMEEFTL